MSATCQWVLLYFLTSYFTWDYKPRKWFAVNINRILGLALLGPTIDKLFPSILSLSSYCLSIVTSVLLVALAWSIFIYLNSEQIISMCEVSQHDMTASFVTTGYRVAFDLAPDIRAPCSVFGPTSLPPVSLSFLFAAAEWCYTLWTERPHGRIPFNVHTPTALTQTFKHTH